MGEWRYNSTFSTSALDGGEWLSSPLSRFTPGERAPDIHWIGGWVCPRAGLEDVEMWKISCPCLVSNPTRPAHSRHCTDWAIPALNAKLFLFLIMHHAMKTYGEGRYKSTSLDFCIYGGEWSPSRLSRFTVWERAPGTLWIGGWASSRTHLETAPVGSRLEPVAIHRHIFQTGGTLH
jgi:hypothetical protein